MQDHYNTADTKVQEAKEEFYRAYAELQRAQDRFQHAVRGLDHSLRVRAAAYEQPDGS